jgi:16S rRNA processing protein RimM
VTRTDSRDLLLVGRVARSHGNKGQVIVNPETDFAERRFQEGRTLLVGPEADPVPRQIRSVRFHQGRPIVALDGIETMNDAEALAGADLWVPAADVEPLPENTFYRHDLVGCEVRDTQGRVVGRVTKVEGPLERSHLVVHGHRGEAMIPMVAGMVTVDLAAKTIVVDPPEGLLDL